jgi:PPOX class probable F420-dependent enzyme
MDLDPRIRELLRGPNFAHLATLLGDGSPHVATVWVGWERGRIAFVKEARAVALKNLRRDPRVAISINGVEQPYDEAHIRGRAISFAGDPEAHELLESLSWEYTGQAYPGDGEGLIKIVVEIDRAGFSEGGGLEHTPPAAPLHLTRSRACSEMFSTTEWEFDRRSRA